jgi:hypothetical protein
VPFICLFPAGIKQEMCKINKKLIAIKISMCVQFVCLFLAGIRQKICMI